MAIQTVFLIFFLLFSNQSSSRRDQDQKIKIRQKSFPKNSLPEKQIVAKKIQKCNQSSESELYSTKYIVSRISHFSNQVEDFVDKHFPYIKKKEGNQCPKSCRQINNYRVSAKVYPLNVYKNSCLKEEAKETYSFRKKFSFKQNKNSIKKAHENMRKWIFAIFVDPYDPLSWLKKPNKLAMEHNILKACPSCSFYFDYNYKYTKDNHLDLHITTRCGDKRSFFSKFSAQFTLINSWSCKLEK